MSTFLRRAVAPMLAVTLGVSATLLGAPSSADRVVNHRDGKGYQLKAKDAADLARAMGVAASPTNATSRLAAASSRTVTVAPRSGPDFEMPFVCGTSWTGTTRASHSPSRFSVDFNAPSDLGKPVLASAPGTVTLVRSLTYSYGRYVVIDHGGGFTTLYAHLNSLAVVAGQRVDQGDLVGAVGTSGGSTGPHLHFEQRLNGAWFAPYFTRAVWKFGATAASRNCGDRPTVGDWDGDGTDEVAVFKQRPRKAGHFRTLVDGTRANIPFGASADTPVVGDYDGNGQAQVGTKALGSTTWRLRSANGAVATVAGVGGSTDVPLAGDWNGNGRAELGWYRWSNRTFYQRMPDLSVRTVVWGASGRIPVVGDWDGDGIDDVGTFDGATGTWHLRFPSGSSFVTRTIQYGVAGDLPAVGDWNGDGADEVGIWRPSTGFFWQRHVDSPGATTATSVAVEHGLKRG